MLALDLLERLEVRGRVLEGGLAWVSASASRGADLEVGCCFSFVARAIRRSCSSAAICLSMGA